MTHFKSESIDMSWLSLAWSSSAKQNSFSAKANPLKNRNYKQFFIENYFINLLQIRINRCDWAVLNAENVSIRRTFMQMDCYISARFTEDTKINIK